VNSCVCVVAAVEPESKEDSGFQADSAASDAQPSVGEEDQGIHTYTPFISQIMHRVCKCITVHTQTCVFGREHRRRITQRNGRSETKRGAIPESERRQGQTEEKTKRAKETGKKSLG